VEAAKIYPPRRPSCVRSWAPGWWWRRRCGRQGRRRCSRERRGWATRSSTSRSGHVSPPGTLHTVGTR